MAVLKSGANRLPPGLLSMVTSWRVALGVALFLLSSVFYVLGIRHGSLTVLFPMVSLSYIWGVVWARIFFHEPFNRSKLVGLVLLSIGVIFIGLGNR
ncbi:MAG TPA: EamA family transporter [Terriglobales bacterium]|nr:EamA family transporter [Terriglobales bacterium]